MMIKQHDQNPFNITSNDRMEKIEFVFEMQLRLERN